MSATRTCSVCGKSFEPRFRFQVEQDGDRSLYFCSQRCQQGAVLAGDSQGVQCTCCGNRFKLEYAYQVSVTDDGRRYFCSERCKEKGAESTATTRHTRRIAVFNHKGGTGKTTSAVNIAAGLAELGKRVLLVDMDAQGNVGVALGVKCDRTMYHVFVLGCDPAEAIIHARPGVDVITANETLAAAELYLSSRPNRDRILRERLIGSDAYDVVILDCSPSLSLLNQNALVYADYVLIPVSCDYLALVGVKQVIKTMRNVYEHLKHPVQIIGVLPTFYDARHKIGREVVDTLKQKFGELCLPPIRANIKLRESPAAHQSIFEYAADSHGTEDYRTVVQILLNTIGQSSRSPSTSPQPPLTTPAGGTPRGQPEALT